MTRLQKSVASGKPNKPLPPCISADPLHRGAVRFVFLLLLLLSSCTAWERSPGAAHFTRAFPLAQPSPGEPLAKLDPLHPAHLPESPATPPAALPPVDIPPAPSAAQPRLPAAVHRTTTRGIALTFLTFDDRDYTLQVADQSGGPGTEWPDARSAALAHHAVAAINASFFTPEGDPLGLVIEDGSRFGAWNTRSSLGSGLLAVHNSSPALHRRERWPSTRSAEHLLQAGPFLLERGSPVSGLSTSPSRPRSFLAWDGRHHWALGYAASATLSDLATALAAQPLPATPFSLALNLDGGRSSDLWVAPSLPGGSVATRRLWNSPVRNFILLRARP